MATNGDQQGHPEKIDPCLLSVKLGLSLLFFVVCLFLPAGTWKWARGWLFILVMAVSSILVMLYLRRVNPEVIAARINRHEGTKRWDRILVAIMLPTLLAIPILAALDDGRFHWLPVPWWCCVLGFCLLIAGMLGLTWAESVNKFFEPSVRIQTDRGHRVVETGPYAIVRHPGYALGFLFFLGIPLALGSLWGLVPAFLLMPLLVMRTILEDRTLQAELPGYKEYAQRVRYRLLPGIW